MSSIPPDSDQERRRPPIRAWRYDEGYGEDRYAAGRAATPRRRRRRRRGPLAWLRRGPQGELLELLSILPRRHPLPTALVAGLGVWLLWPSLAPRSALQPGAPEVITVFVEDPQRTAAALDVWKARPGALLVMQGRPDTQAQNLQAMRDRGLLKPAQGGFVTLTRGCDTLGQLTTLADFLKRQPRPGRLTVVTGPAHLQRSMAIARIVIGSAGWQVEGLAADTGDIRPESAWRLWRDQARAQLWRATGWDGSSDGTACRGRALGLG